MKKFPVVCRTQSSLSYLKTCATGPCPESNDFQQCKSNYVCHSEQSLLARF